MLSFSTLASAAEPSLELLELEGGLELERGEAWSLSEQDPCSEAANRPGSALCETNGAKRFGILGSDFGLALALHLVRALGLAMVLAARALAAGFLNALAPVATLSVVLLLSVFRPEAFTTFIGLPAFFMDFMALAMVQKRQGAQVEL